ncbi:Abscisic acid receptor PYL8-like protein [Drosera capensis]
MKVWSLVQRFNQLQKYKLFINRCIVHGKLEKGSLREVGVKSDLSASHVFQRQRALRDWSFLMTMSTSLASESLVEITG